MSQDKFTNLMTQFGDEAEAQKIAEMRAARRRVIFRRIRKTVLYLMFLGACGAGYRYRDTLNADVTEIKKLLPQSPYKQADQATRAKVSDIKAQAEKRNAVLEATYK